MSNWEDFDPLSDKPKPAPARQASTQQSLPHLVAQQPVAFHSQPFAAGAGANPFAAPSASQTPFGAAQPWTSQQQDPFANPFAAASAPPAEGGALKKKKVVKKKKAPVEDGAAKSSVPSSASRTTSAPGSWNCTACTYLNGPSSSKCEMCESPKPFGNGTAAIAAVAQQLEKTNVNKKKNTKQESSDEEESSEEESSEEDSSEEDSSDDEEEHKKPKTKTKTKTTTKTTVGPDGKKVKTKITEKTKTKAAKGFVPANGKCSITGCAQPHHNQGYCQMHLKNPNAPVTRMKHPDMWQTHFSRTTTKMGFNKNAVVWKFWHKGECHEVELFHSTFGGKRTVKVNGVLVLTEKKLVDNGSRYKLEVGSTDLAHAIITVEIKVVGVSFTYELYIQDRPFEEAKAYWLKNPDF